MLKAGLNRTAKSVHGTCRRVSVLPWLTLLVIAFYAPVVLGGRDFYLSSWPTP
jgi:hypothetical protein